MATSTARLGIWNYQSVGPYLAYYILSGSPFDLVSHIRSAHNSSSVICEVNDCQESFKTPGIWYQHVGRNHFSEYLRGNRNISHDN